MDILLFGGAFDPVHNAHINNLKAALKYKAFDKVIIMPTGTPGHKTGCRAPFAVRKLLAEKAFLRVCPQAEVSPFEGDSLQRSFSYITVEHLLEEYPGAKIYFLIGADSAISMHTWRNWEFLAKNAAFLVLTREEGQDERLEEAVKKIKALSPDTAVLPARPMPLSSTQIREIIARGGDFRPYVDGDVGDIIRENHLYSRDFYRRNIGTAQLLIPLLLKEKRAVHTKNVARLARQFAEKYGENPQKAYLAGLLHDIQKEVPPRLMLERAMAAGDAEVIKNKPIPVIHGFAAADYARREMGIEDEDLLNSLKSHTCGRPNMSTLEKIVYLRDMLSRERDYPEKEGLLALAWQDLDICMEQALSDSLKWVSQKGGTLDRDTRRAYEYYARENRKKGERPAGLR